MRAGQSWAVARAAAPAAPTGPPRSHLPLLDAENRLRALISRRQGGSMSYSVVDVEDVPYVWGTFKFVRHHLGATAFGFTQIDFPPEKVGSEHDESASGQEEVYLTLSGAGTLEIDGETVEMRPGRYVLVPPSSRAAPHGRGRRHVVSRDRRSPRRRVRPLAPARGMIVRIVLWRLDETTPPIGELRDRLERAGAASAARARSSSTTPRSGSARSLVADEDEPPPASDRELRAARRAATPTSTRSSTRCSQMSDSSSTARADEVRTKNPRFAGRSARRRIRYGYHSGP